MNEEAKTKVKQAIDSAVNNLVENLEQGKSEALISFLEGILTDMSNSAKLSSQIIVKYQQ
jgi:hypothetical protein